MFSILNEIANNSHFRTTAVVGASIGTAAFMYILVGITGYLSYGDHVNDNIVSMYAPSVATTIGRLAIVILVMFSYPLQVHPCRASVDAVIKWRPNTKSKKGNESSPSPGRTEPLLGPAKPAPPHPTPSEMSDIRFAVLTTCIIILSYIVAMTVSSLGMVLAYVGSTGSTTISFILPGLFYYKISSPNSPAHQRLLKEDDDEEEYDSGPDTDNAGGSQRLRTRNWRRGLIRKLALALAIYGICVMIVCLITNTFLVARH